LSKREIDPLDTEISVSGELTQTGIKGAAKSRAVSGLDRLLGNVFELGNVALEGIVSPARAKIEGERKLIDALVKQGVKLIGSDSEFAERALAHQFSTLLRKQENRDGVAKAALEDLRRSPPSVDDDVKQETLSDPFLDRLEHYAEFATTDELRERWGRVLAAEVRAPGTFGGKVLRVVDEIDPETAKIFEALCLNRIDRVVPRHLAGELSFRATELLTTNGLILEPTLNQIRVSKPSPGADPLFDVFQVGRVVIVVPKQGQPGSWGDSYSKDFEFQPLQRHPELGLVFPTYVLTDVGFALSKILPDNQIEAGKKLAEAIAGVMPGVQIELGASYPPDMKFKSIAAFKVEVPSTPGAKPTG
jgi:hypothetical protein